MMTGIGFDEALYRQYVTQLSQLGLQNYPSIVDNYLSVQKTLPGSILPPVRFLYIFAGYLWQSAFGSEPLDALRNVACLFSILTLALSGLFAWRLGGMVSGLGVLALVCFAPTQIHMSQHALVDGFFTFWALLCLWLLWENLQRPGSAIHLIGYSLGLTLLVLTKENAVFAFIGLVSILLLNRWLQFGTVTRELVVSTVVGPLLGAVVLVFLAGGIDVLTATYSLSLSKNLSLQYAILTGDGPWHRYLVDLLLVSPVVLLLALGALFRLKSSQKPELYLIVFVTATYLVMCNLKYGMNLRYANMWDMPLRFLAVSAIGSLVPRWHEHHRIVLACAIGMVCLAELHQYIVLCVNFPLYELVSEGLLRALHILK